MVGATGGGEWYHVASTYNAADPATRIATDPKDLALGSCWSDWLTGPSYLKLPVTEWPINRNFAERKTKLKIPVGEVKKRYRSQVEDLDDFDCLVG